MFDAIPYTGGSARNVARDRAVTRELSKIADVSPGPIFNRFTTQPTIDGFEVIDSDGRTVAEKGTLREATGTAFRLNRAAASGGRALATALGCK